MKSAAEIIDVLAGSALFRGYRQAFTRATDLPLVLRPVEDGHLPLHGQPGESPWCRMIAGHSPACAACMAMQERLAARARRRPVTLTCSYGLSETAVPVMKGRETLGYLQTGQVMLRQPRESSFRDAFEQTIKRGARFNERAARKAYFETRVVSPAKMRACRDLLEEFAEHLSLRSNQIVVQTTHVESRMITRAKRSIAQHLDERLTLHGLARRVNASVFYLCRQFKKETGLTFTEYVNRRRIQRARQLLLQPNLAISEVAYESGYQSLTHFNRMFRRIAGESPTSYRLRVSLDMHTPPPMATPTGES